MTANELARILGITGRGVRKRALKERWRHRLVANPRGGGKMMVFVVRQLPGDVQKIVVVATDKQNQERREKILAAMAEKGVTQTEIARQIEVCLPTVCHVIAGRFTSRRVVSALIEAGVPKELFQSYKS